MNRILIGIPTHDGKVLAGTIRAVMHAARENGFEFEVEQSSILPKCFNTLYAKALARRPELTHFAMLHADILPQDLWLDKLVRVMTEGKYDLVSTVVPMKETTGITSTATEAEAGSQHRRLTLKEVFEKPPTFTDSKLLLNTGCMLVDLRHPEAANLYFAFQDKIIRHGEDGFYVTTFPEDWFFSKMAREKGMRIAATREVELIHCGNHGFANTRAWGRLETDEYYKASVELKDGHRNTEGCGSAGVGCDSGGENVS